MASKTKKKTQAAMEFLVTYGWAIVLVLVVIGALSYFGVLSPAKLLPDKCNFQVGFSCVDYSATREGYPVPGLGFLQTTPPTLFSINFDVVNNMGEDVYVTKVEVSGKDIKCIHVQFETCQETGEPGNSFINGGAFSPFNTCFSVNEACDSNLCQGKTATEIVRWHAGQKMKSNLGYSSDYLSLLCSELPLKGQKTDATITVEYTKSDPDLTGALKHTAYGEFFITVS